MITPSFFHPPLLIRSAHAQTIIPSLFRSKNSPPGEHGFIETPDHDLLRYRLFKRSNPRLALISHGLEGSYDSSYVIGMVRALTANGWDALCWNMRGCGGEPNRLVSWYHSGKSDDLKAVLDFSVSLGYDEIALIGFSVGGNITLKYLGESGSAVHPSVSKAVAVSVPMDLAGSAQTLAHRRNWVYMEYLLRPLRKRIREKAERFPGVFDLRGLDTITTFREFDDRFTAPFHGFASVEEYWRLSSSRAYLQGISIPTLAVSALDDPFLSPSCFPHAVARNHTYLTLETPDRGGHVGFLESLSLRTTWLERRTVAFLSERG